MLEKQLSEWGEKWDITPDMVQDLREFLTDFGNTCYRLGYFDCQEETKYYSGFSYGKKEDLDEFSRLYLN